MKKSRVSHAAASDSERFEQAASYRDLLRTLTEIEERQKNRRGAGDDTDVLAWHAEPPLVAVNLFHLRGGRVVDRRDFYWEDLEPSNPLNFCPRCSSSSLGCGVSARAIHGADGFRGPRDLEDILTERAANLEPPRSRVEILMPQRARSTPSWSWLKERASLFEQRFRVLKPSSTGDCRRARAGPRVAEPPRRIESFDISHLQGSDTFFGGFDGCVGKTGG